MLNRNGQLLSRVALALLILLSGLALLPFSGLSAQKLGWELFAGVYNPDLNVVGEDKGYPGSAFEFFGSGYPANALATVYVDGNARGTLMTDAQGNAGFLIQSEPSDPFGRYYITLATDANTSATDDVRLEDNAPILPPPTGWNGPVFFLFGETLTPTPTSTATVVPPTPTATPPPSGVHTTFLPIMQEE